MGVGELVFADIDPMSHALQEHRRRIRKWRYSYEVTSDPDATTRIESVLVQHDGSWRFRDGAVKDCQLAGLNEVLQAVLGVSGICWVRLYRDYLMAGLKVIDGVCGIKHPDVDY